MAHTPGPYIVRDCSDALAEKFTIERVTDGLRSVLCRINDMEVCPEHGGTGSRANAYLFAAAPDMFGLLEELARTIDDDHFYRDRLLSVIAKAKGASYGPEL